MTSEEYLVNRHHFQGDNNMGTDDYMGKFENKRERTSVVATSSPVASLYLKRQPLVSLRRRSVHF